MAGLAIGTVLAIMIFMGGHVSGGHFNPAVTVAIKVKGDDSLTPAVLGMYIGAQVAGGLIAAATGYALTMHSWSPVPGPETTLWQVVLAEVLFTFALVIVILNVCHVGCTIAAYPIGNFPLFLKREYYFAIALL